jgi:phospholipid/cholesterol/gamma-HCH transport system permease protein
MAREPTNQPQGTLQVETDADGALVLRFRGRLDSAGAGELWRRMVRELERRRPARVVVDGGEVTYCDGSGLALLFELELRGRREGFEVERRGLREEFRRLLEEYDGEAFGKAPAQRPHRLRPAEEVGRVAVGALDDVRSQVDFLGHLSAALFGALCRPWRVRWKDALLVAERAGANAVGIILLIGFLFGLILSFSSAVPLKEFGAEIYVSDLVAIGLARVLGPFVTAILLAGRSGSAFAAELGTMKVNNELDALQTMGLEPVRFLVVPRVLAATFVTPLLAVLTNLAGLVGTAAVLVSFGYPLVAITHRMREAIDTGDVLAGLFKALVFGGLIGAVSCLRGLQTGHGPSAVGDATTRAVVSSIILIVVAEGVFAVLFFFLGI